MYTTIHNPLYEEILDILTLSEPGPKNSQTPMLNIYTLLSHNNYTLSVPNIEFHVFVPISYLSSLKTLWQNFFSDHQPIILWVCMPACIGYTGIILEIGENSIIIANIRQYTYVLVWDGCQ